MARSLALLVLVTALTAVSCGFSTPPATPVPIPTLVPLPPGAPVANLAISRNMHQSVEVSVGTTIIWTNEDSIQHTSIHTPTERGVEIEWNSKRLPSDTKFQHTFNNVGTFRYVCTIHTTTMKATITVVEASGS